MKLFLRLLRESFIFSFNSIIANPVSTILSLLGVTIGIFTIIAVLSTVDSLERSIKDNLSFLGTDNLRVEKWPWDFDNPSYEWWKFWKRPEPIYREYEFLRDNFPNLELIEGDALTEKWPKANKVVANIPYQISSPLIDVITRTQSIDYVVILVQEEFAERLVVEWESDRGSLGARV